MISRSIFMLCCFFTVLIMGMSCRAGDCSYGSAQAWFKSPQRSWENATAHPLLHRGETFEIQVVITTESNLSVFFIKLHEFGTPVYEVLEGPSKIEQILEHRGMMTSGERFSYVWQLHVRIDTSWVNGYAPLELYVQFNKNDEESESVHFDVLTAFITDEPRKQHQEESFQDTRSSATGESHPLPSSGVGGIIFLVVFLVLSYRGLKQKGKNRG